MNFKTAPAFTLSKSLKKTITDMTPHNPITPGPIYNVSGLGQRQPSLSHNIGKSQRSSINHWAEETPSPMHYEPKLVGHTVHHSFPKSSFNQPINLNPDPACYVPDQKHTNKKVLAYTLSSRYPSVVEPSSNNPGPANYQGIQPLPILSRSKNNKQVSFGTASRFKQLSSDQPGAGQYDVTAKKLTQIEQKCVIGKADRHPRIQCTPGPSDYHKLSFVETNIKRKIGMTLGFGTKSHTKLINERTTINAFHKYFQNPENQFTTSISSPKYSLGKEKRQLIKPNHNPGPTEYINNDFVTKHSSVALMPRSEHKQYNDALFKPGPGTYRIEAQKGHQYTFPRSKSMAIVNNAPGVGRYEVEGPAINRKGISFGKSSRFNKEQRMPVGVGEYNLIEEKQFKGSISKSSRFKQQMLSTPGPGDYHIHSLIGRTSEIQK